MMMICLFYFVEQNDDSKEGGKTLDENKVPVFPNPLIITSSPTPSKVNRNRHNKNIRKKNEDVEEMLSWLNLKDYPFTTNKNSYVNIQFDQSLQITLF